MTNLYQVFRTTAQQQPDRIAITDCEKQLAITYGEFLQQIDTLAEELRGAGVCANECVGIHLASGTHYIRLTYALWKCGACVVPIPLELAAREKRHICKRIAIRTVISCDKSVWFLSGFSTQQVEWVGKCRVIHISPAREHPPGFREINAAFIRFSSGTTGAAKGVVLSHETIFDRIHAANAGMKITPDDRVVWLLSMAYHFAVSIVAYLSFGATTILHKRGVDLGRAVVEDAAEQGGTIIYGSPQQYQLISRVRSGIKLDRLRLVISTATSLSVDIAESFLARFGVPLTQAYGIIEVGLPCINFLNDTTRIGSVGRVLPAYEVRLFECDGISEGGSIAFRGKGFLDAYYDPWQPRAEIMADGWFRTGDLGELDEDGYLFIRGRSNEMINVGGMKFFPQEVEYVLASHPAVQEAVVFAAKRGSSREVACAQVVIGGEGELPTAAQLRQYCAKRLAHFKVPQEVEVVPALKRTASGKVVRQPVTLDS